MDPSLLNFAGPSNYHLPPQHHQQQQHAQQHQHQQHQSHLMQQQHPSAYQMSGSSLVQPAFASSPSTPSSRAPGTNASPYPDAASIDHSDMPSDSRAAPMATGPLVEPHQELNDFLENFWMRQMDNVEREEQDGKVNVSLPLARIKKVMKSDEEVKMISAEVPIMFSKACEVFISELTCRAWLIAESHKRRTLQKSDVAAAIAHSDMFDFLIDIVPRDGENGDSGEGGDSKAQSVGDDDGQDEGEDEGEEMYREYVEGDE